MSSGNQKERQGLLFFNPSFNIPKFYRLLGAVEAKNEKCSAAVHFNHCCTDLYGYAICMCSKLLI